MLQAGTSLVHGPVIQQIVGRGLRPDMDLRSTVETAHWDGEGVASSKSRVGGCDGKGARLGGRMEAKRAFGNRPESGCQEEHFLAFSISLISIWY